jgi:gliding motility-associated-like protein
MRKLIILLFVLVANYSFGQTTFPWSGTYGGTGTNRTYTTTVSGVTMSATMVNSENVWQDASPKWFPTGSTNPGGGCSGIGAVNEGMLLSTDWTTNTTKTITTVITFSTPVQGPVNFLLYDINDDGFGSWEDRIIITGTNSVASPVNVFKVGTACVQTGGSVTGSGTNTLTFNSGISTSCTCWGNNEINVGTAADCISTVTIQYRSNTSPTSYNNPKQYIVISNVKATIPTPVSAPTSITGTTTICGSGSTTLTAVGGGANTLWYTGSCGGTSAGSGASITVSPSSTTTYYAANSGGCGILSACANATVTVNPQPTAVAGSALALNCTTTSGTISVSTNAGSPGYLWTGPGIVSGNTTSSPTVNAAGTYNVTVTNTATGCTNTTSVNVTMNNTQPTAVPGSPLALTCTVLSGTISASSNAAGATYLWTGPGIVSGNTTASPTVNAAGTYNVTITNPANGCTNTTSVNVTLNNTQPTAVPGSALALSCAIPSGTISASSNAAGATYLWTGPGIVSGSTTSSPTVNAAGTYNLTVTNPANGCTNTTSVNVTLNNTQPTAVPGSALALSCTTPTGTISASSNAAGATYLWTGPGIVSGNTTSSPTVNAAGTYNVTITNPANGCTNTTSVNVTMNNTQPTAVPGSALALTCTTTSGTISASSNAAGATYLWTGPGIVSGSTTSSPTVNAAGTYNVTITNPANGCTNTTSVNVTMNNTQPTAVPGSALALTCTTTSGTISASSNAAGATYVWTGPGIVSGSTTSSPTVNAAGTYNVTITNPANGCTNTTSVNVTMNNTQPTAVPGSALALTCATTSGTISASSNAAGATYVWTGPGIVSGSTTSSPTVNAAGTYNVTVTNPVNGCTNTTSVNVTMNNTQPTAVPGSALALTCTTTSGTISASSNATGATFVWSGPGIVSGSTTSSPTVNAAGTYNVTVTNPANGCTNTTSVNVTLNNTQPTAVPGSALALTCTTTSGTISASSNAAGATFVWSGPGIVSGGTTSSPTVNAAGTYNVTVTNPANGCTNTTSVNVTLNNTQPTAVAGSALALTCTTTSGTISASSNAAGATFVWSGPGIVSGSTTSSPTVNAAGTYNVTVTNPANGCTNTTSVNVTLNNTQPTAVPGSALALNCTTTSGTISASSNAAGATFVWSGPGIVSGGTTSSPTVNAAGTYNVTVTNPANGCTNTTSVNVTMNNTAPNISMGADQVLNCSVSSVTISGSSNTSGATYSWTDSGNNPAGNTPTASSTTVMVAGVYTLTITNPTNGCTITGTVNVTSSGALPDLTVGADQELNCLTNTVIIDGSSTILNPVYSWTDASSNPAGTTPNSSSTSVSTPGVYTLTVTNPLNGCSTSATVIVTNNPDPISVAGINDTINCIITSVNLDGTGSSVGSNFSYLWTGPSITNGSTTLNPTVDEPGTYTLTVTDANTGCTSATTVVIVADTIAPVIVANTNSTINCNNSQITIDASASTGSNLDFAWSGPGIISGGNTSSPLVNQAGNYDLLLTNTANGCTDNFTVTVIVDTIVPIITTGNDTTFNCGVVNVVLDVTNVNGATYLWSGTGIVSGGNTSSVTVNQSGNYSVTVTGANGCSSTDDITISFGTGPNAAFTLTPNSGQVPIVVSTDNNSTGNGLSYLWNFDNGSTSTAIDTSTIYTLGGTYDVVLVVVDSLGCRDTARVQITLDNSDLDIPNGFTPNGDMINDVFQIVGLEQYPENKITIFNRWGELVFTAEPYLSDWDGRCNNPTLVLTGDKVVDGTYFFVLDLGNGTPAINGYVEMKSR